MATPLTKAERTRARKQSEDEVLMFAHCTACQHRFMGEPRILVRYTRGPKSKQPAIVHETCFNRKQMTVA